MTAQRWPLRAQNEPQTTKTAKMGENVPFWKFSKCHNFSPL
jgi:hypothetical protein